MPHKSTFHYPLNVYNVRTCKTANRDNGNYLIHIYKLTQQPFRKPFSFNTKRCTRWWSQKPSFPRLESFFFFFLPISTFNRRSARKIISRRKSATFRLIFIFVLVLVRERRYRRSGRKTEKAGSTDENNRE